MADWQTGNLGRLNASIQAMGEAGRIKESKKNRFASIAEGLTNNLFKRQSETAAQQHDKDMEKIMYGGGEGTPVGTRTASQMAVNQQEGDIAAQSLERSFAEWSAGEKAAGRDGSIGSYMQAKFGYMPSNYYDKYNKDNQGDSLWLNTDLLFKQTKGPAQFLTKDADGFNELDWSKFIDPKTGVADQKKVAEAKAAMTTWLEGAIRDDPSLAKTFGPAQQKDAVRRYVENIFNQAQGVTESTPVNNKAEAIARINAIKDLIKKSGATKDQINAANAQYKAEGVKRSDGTGKHFAMSIDTEKPVVEMLNVMPDNDVIATMNDYEDYLNKLKTIMNPKARSGY